MDRSRLVPALPGRPGGRCRRMPYNPRACRLGRRCAQQCPVADDPGARQWQPARRRGRRSAAGRRSSPALSCTPRSHRQRPSRCRARSGHGFSFPGGSRRSSVDIPPPRYADPVPHGVAGSALAQCRLPAHDHMTRRDVLTVPPAGHPSLTCGSYGRRRRPGPGPASPTAELGPVPASARAGAASDRPWLAHHPRPHRFRAANESVPYSYRRRPGDMGHRRAG